MEFFNLLIVLLLIVAFWSGGILIGSLTMRGSSGSPLETFTEMVLRSLTIIGLLLVIAYVLQLASWMPVSAILCLTLLAALKRASLLSFLFRDVLVRKVLTSFVLLELWILVATSLIGSYSGGGLYWDRFEHYQRARHVAELWPTTHTFGNYSLAARPMLGNAMVAASLSAFGSEYIYFQLTTALLSGVLVLPLVSLSRLFDGPVKSPTWITSGVLLLNPMFVHNATFPWTKQLSALFVLWAVFLFLSGAAQEGERNLRSRRGFFWLAIATLVHYSAIPWAITASVAHLLDRKTKLKDRLINLLCYPVAPDGLHLRANSRYQLRKR